MLTTNIHKYVSIKLFVQVFKRMAWIPSSFSQNGDSDLAYILKLGRKPHQGVWIPPASTTVLPISLSRVFDDDTIARLNYDSGLVAAAVTALLIATAPDEFGIPECATTLAAAGLEGPHRWGIILPNSSRVSLLTYKAIVAVRYPELALHDVSRIQIGHFVLHDLTVEYGDFRTVLWEIVAFLAFLQRRHRNLHQGATAQLLVMYNRTAIYNQLVQHGFHTTWEGGLRITTSSSAAGATARIAIMCRQVVASWMGVDEVSVMKNEKIVMAEQLWP